MTPKELYRFVEGSQVWTLTSADADEVYNAGEGDETRSGRRRTRAQDAAAHQGRSRGRGAGGERAGDAEQFGDGAVEARFDDSVQFTDGSSIVRAGHRPRADMPV